MTSIEEKCLLSVKNELPRTWGFSSEIYAGFEKLYDEFDKKYTILSLLLKDSGDKKYLTEMQKLSCEYTFKMMIRFNILAFGLSENPHLSSTVEQMIKSGCKEKGLEYTSFATEVIYKQLVSELSMDERKQALWGLCKVYFTRAVEDLGKSYVNCDRHTATDFYNHEFRPADIKIDLSSLGKMLYLTDLTHKLVDKYIDTDTYMQFYPKNRLDEAHEQVERYMNTCAMEFGLNVVDIAFTGTQHN